MTNEVKLWQRRAGLLSESEYMDSMEETEMEEMKIPDFLKGKVDPEAIKKGIQAVYNKIADVNKMLVGPPFTTDDDYAATEEIKDIKDQLMAIQGIINKKILAGGVNEAETELTVSDEPSTATGDDKKPAVTSGTALATSLVQKGRELQGNADSKKGIGSTEADKINTIITKLMDAGITPDNRTTLLRTIEAFIDNKLKNTKPSV